MTKSSVMLVCLLFVSGCNTSAFAYKGDTSFHKIHSQSCGPIAISSLLFNFDICETSSSVSKDILSKEFLPYSIIKELASFIHMGSKQMTCPSQIVQCCKRYGLVLSDEGKHGIILLFNKESWGYHWSTTDSTERFEKEWKTVKIYKFIKAEEKHERVH